MNAHPDTATAAALDAYTNRLHCADKARLIRQAESRNLKRSRRRPLTTLPDYLLTVFTRMPSGRAATPYTVIRSRESTICAHQVEHN